MSERDDREKHLQADRKVLEEADQLEADGFGWLADELRKQVGD